MTSRLAWLAIGVMLWPRSAEAHLVSTGLGPLYDGISHVLVSPDDLLPVLALGLLAGLNGAAAGRRALFALPAAWLIGGSAGVILDSAWLPASIAAASCLVLGLLSALDRRLSPALVTALAISVGLLHGFLNGVAIGEDQREALGLIGIASATFVLVALTAAPVTCIRVAWARVACRVAGSWIAAVGLLMVGWSIRSAG